MSTYYGTYPEIPTMGLRGSLNAMLEHVAYNRHDFGYLPSAVHQANNEGLLEDFGTILEDDRGVPVLAPHIEDSAALADLADTLATLCNDYPAYDDERVSEIEHERLLDMVEEVREEDHPEAEDIARALYEIGAYVEQSEYGANVSEEDFEAAIAYARREEAEDLARAHGQVELF